MQSLPWVRFPVVLVSGITHHSYKSSNRVLGLLPKTVSDVHPSLWSEDSRRCFKSPKPQVLQYLERIRPSSGASGSLSCSLLVRVRELRAQDPSPLWGSLASSFGGSVHMHGLSFPAQAYRVTVQLVNLPS